MAGQRSHRRVSVKTGGQRAARWVVVPAVAGSIPSLTPIYPSERATTVFDTVAAALVRNVSTITRLPDPRSQVQFPRFGLESAL
jgi:hypothetical protein